MRLHIDYTSGFIAKSIWGTMQKSAPIQDLMTKHEISTLLHECFKSVSTIQAAVESHSMMQLMKTCLQLPISKGMQQ